MQGRVANCPSCGGQVEFKANTSIVTVCPYCSSAVARTGDDIGALEIAGKVAPLADIGSPLSLGTEGKLQGKRFTLVGRMQLNYGEGPWNEWYAAFDDGRWGWVAEAQGRVYLTTKQSGASAVPGFSGLGIGAVVEVRGFPLSVAEKNSAEFVSAEGELPEPIHLGERYYYADIEGQGGVFGTLDYGAEPDGNPEVFLGKRFEYSDLFSKSILRDREAAQAGVSDPMSCPNCGAAVELQAPDEAKHVTCGYCDALLDCEGSALSLLQAAAPLEVPPQIELGASAKYKGNKYTVYGYMLRAAEDEDYDGSIVQYPWEEYLLRDEKSGGYSWLVCSDGHWSWVESVSPPQLKRNWMSDLPSKLKHEDTNYQRLSQYASSVLAVRGEFYWKVAVGDRAQHVEFIAPPKGLSVELTAEEISWSRSEYLTPAEVKAIFPKLKRLSLPKPKGVGATQPNPRRKLRWKALAASLLMVVIAVGLGLGRGSSSPAFREQLPLVPVSQNGEVTDGQPQRWKVQLKGGTLGIQLAGVLARSSHDYGMLYTIVKLDNQQGKIRMAGVQLAAARGAQADRTVYMPSLDAGEYILEVTPQWPAQHAEFSQVTLSLFPGMSFPGPLFFFLILLWIYPAWNHFMRLRFEAARGEG